MNRVLPLALLSIVIALGSPAKAAIISFADTYGPINVPFAAAPLATLSLFDPALGTLDKVTLTLDANTSAGTPIWDNEAAVPSNVTLSIGATVTAVGLAGITAVAVPLQTDSAVGIDAVVSQVVEIDALEQGDIVEPCGGGVVGLGCGRSTGIELFDGDGFL